MAKLYEKLQAGLTSYDDQPKATITEQMLDEAPYRLCGTEQGAAAWYYILVPVNKVAELKAQHGKEINVTKSGRVIEYRNNLGEIKVVTGWGDPPKIIDTWITDQYGPVSIDENISLTYENDDIRLCTMQRAVPEQKLSVYFHYHTRQRFHFIKLPDELQSSLARRAGIKTYDRIIFLNNVNIENDTVDQFLRRFNTERHLPVHMLVCSPATYVHYKANNKLFHSDLPTVQRLKPVYAISASDSTTDTPMVSVVDEYFCVVQWENTNIVSTVPQSAIYKSPEFTHLNDICCVETEGQYRNGKIIFKGSYSDCVKLSTGSCTRKHDATPDTLSLEKFFQKLGTNTIQDQVATQNMNDDIHHIQERVCTTLEQLPNELFFYLFTHNDIQHLYNAFWGLNSRLNSIFQSCQNLCLIFDKNTDLLLLRSYASRVVRLIINTSINCDLSQFHNLRTLILRYKNFKDQTQFQPDILPNLTYLSFLFGLKFSPPLQLVHDVFSNKFLSLRHVNLGSIEDSVTYSWSTSPSLQCVSIHSNKSNIAPVILASCPNLHHLRLYVSSDSHISVLSSSLSNHPLQRLTLWSDSDELTFNGIDTLLTYTPNVQHLYLQTICRMPFVHLINGIVNRLHDLRRFDCHVQEMMTRDARIGDLTTIYQIHPYFSRIRCIEENDNFRMFATE